MFLPRTQQPSTMTLNISPFLYCLTGPVQWFVPVPISMSNIHSPVHRPAKAILLLPVPWLTIMAYTKCFILSSLSLISQPIIVHFFHLLSTHPCFIHNNLNTNILITQQELFFLGTDTFKESSTSSIALKRLSQISLSYANPQFSFHLSSFFSYETLSHLVA